MSNNPNQPNNPNNPNNPNPPAGAPAPGIQVQANEETQRGFYSNVARIAHTPEEFIVDFLFITHDPPFGKLGSRVLVSPGHAKRLLAALSDNLQKYEARFGEIRVSPAPEIPGGLN